MRKINALKFKRDLLCMLEHTVKRDEPVQITSKFGDAVLISAQEYRNMLATIEIQSVPGAVDEILDGAATPLSDCVPASAVV